MDRHTKKQIRRRHPHRHNAPKTDSKTDEKRMLTYKKVNTN